ncbi:MAG: helix-turn-helix domain-containing protein [Aliarcobacter sp.]|jgi:DNA-binding response OmpR family regulator|nr:helix-turn-helix domain-containing protein [Aliarcobacter sp.]
MNSIFLYTTNNKNVNSVLVISEDVGFLDRLKKVSGDKYNISFFNSENFNLLNTEINTFDLIVFDNSKNSLTKFVDVFKQTKSYTFNIPMIILEDKVSQEFSLHKYSNAYAIFNKDNDESFLLNNIEISLSFLYTNKKVQFENGFYFDISREILFQGKKIIKLTKTERKLVNLLALNSNTLVTYEDISSIVWRGKEFSIYSLRNVIKHIREKTDESFIKNSSNRGYVITTI